MLKVLISELSVIVILYLKKLLLIKCLGIENKLYILLFFLYINEIKDWFILVLIILDELLFCFDL